MIARLDSDSPLFDSALKSLGEFPEQDRIQIRASVTAILEDVRVRGDEALVELTNRFDGQSASNMAALSIGQDQLLEAYESIDDLVRDALIESADRVREYHEHQKSSIGSGDGWRYTDSMGNQLGQSIRPMSRVGIYAPGGKASYPSTVIMTAIPAQVAGVKEMVLCVPTPGGELNPVLLAAAHQAAGTIDHCAEYARHPTQNCIKAQFEEDSCDFEGTDGSWRFVLLLT